VTVGENMTGKAILVAVDGSAAADAAADAALELAAALRSAVRFVHAAPALADDLYRAQPESGPTQEQIAAADPVLATMRDRAAQAGVDATVEVIGGAIDRGDVAAVIAGTAEGLGAGLIVCGSRGRGAAAGAVLGSVSHNLIRYAAVPVLIVHAPDGGR
jgi:nucleotide-binding universal stress UspA family protein